MIIDLEKYIYNKDGEVSKAKKPRKIVNPDMSVEYDGFDDVFFTIGKALENALLSNDTFLEEKTEDEIVKRFNIFKKVNNQKEVDLNQEEVDFVKKLVVTKFDVFFAGSIVEYLNSLK